MDVFDLEDLARYSAEGAVIAGFVHEYGLLGAPRLEKAVEYYRQAAEHGLPLAQYMLARLSQEGRGGLSKDFSQALSWYQKAAERSFVPAQYALALIYDYGLEQSQDLEKARHWYTKAAESGHDVSAYRLAYIFENGIGIPKNGALSRKWYERAVELGSASAAYVLACADRDAGNNTALQWFNRAAELGSSAAHLYLATVYRQGLHRQPIDEEKASKHMRAAAECADQERVLSKKRRAALLHELNRINPAE